MSSADKEQYITSICFCCSNIDDFGGVYCRGNQHHRTVYSNDGLGPEAQLTLSIPIAQCLLGYTDFPVGGASVDEFGETLDPEILSQIDEEHLANAVHWDKTLRIYAGAIDELRQTSDTTEPELRGFASEAVVAAVLKNATFFPWISSVELQSRNSTLDMKGVDIVISLTEPVASWLKRSSLHIQVKSDPSRLLPFLNKLKVRDGLKHMSDFDYLLQKQIILLSGGAGEVSDQGLIGPFICQVFQLISHNSGEPAASDFLSFIRSSSPNNVYRCVVRAVSQNIIARDYGEIIKILPEV